MFLHTIAYYTYYWFLSWPIYIPTVIDSSGKNILNQRLTYVRDQKTLKTTSPGAKGCLSTKMAPISPNLFLMVDHLGHISRKGRHSETRQ